MSTRPDQPMAHATVEPCPRQADFSFPFCTTGRNLAMEWAPKPDTAHSTTKCWYQAPASRRVGNNSKIALTTFCPAPLEVAYGGWKECDFLPHFMRAAAGPCDAGAQGWRLRLRDEEVPWEAVTTEETSQKRIAWWSKGSQTYRNRGSVSFDSVGRRTTRISVAIEFYESPANAVTEGTLRSLKAALGHSLDLLHVHLVPCAILGPCPASL